MEKIVLKNIKEGDKPIGFLLVTKLEEKLTKNGSAYVVFTLTDGEKEIEANLWNHSITDVTVTPESVASFEINCKIYQEKLSYEICRYMQDDSPVDITDFIKKAPMDSQKMFNEILMICDSAGAEGNYRDWFTEYMRLRKINFFIGAQQRQFITITMVVCFIIHCVW